jgi:hypothetical protein
VVDSAEAVHDPSTAAITCARSETSAAGTALPEVGLEGASWRRIAVDSDNLPLGVERFGNGSANAARGSRHDADSVRELSHGDLLEGAKVSQPSAFPDLRQDGAFADLDRLA